MERKGKRNSSFFCALIDTVYYVVKYVQIMKNMVYLFSRTRFGGNDCYMKTGKAFEIFVKRILMNVGFLEVESDGLFVFDGNSGQMVQGLGEAHNADVLLEPPVQTPFIYRTRLLIECKDYSKKVGLNTVRSA